MAALLFTFAYYSWVERLPNFLNKLNSTKTKSEKPKSMLSAFAAGLVSTIVASPCSTPVLGGVLLMISQTDSQLKGMSLMFLYGMGLPEIKKEQLDYQDPHYQVIITASATKP